MVIGRDNVGGVTGRYLDTVFHCINTGVVSSNNTRRVGSIIGTDSVSTTQLANRTFNSYYDKQMSRYGGKNNVDIMLIAEGRLTTDTTLTGFALDTLLGNEYTYEDCLYPRLGEHFANYVQCSPIFLYIGDSLNYDTHDAINHCFVVSTKYGVK